MPADTPYTEDDVQRLVRLLRSHAFGSRHLDWLARQILADLARTGRLLPADSEIERLRAVVARVRHLATMLASSPDDQAYATAIRAALDGQR